MKRLLFLLVCLIPLGIYAQRINFHDTIYMGTVDTFTYETGETNDILFGGFGSYQFNYNNFDDVDATLYLYWTDEHPDSGTYVLFVVDDNIDGTNDNPWTLSDTANGDFGVTWEFFPGKWFVRIVDPGSVTDSLAGYEYIKQQ